jgi:acyl-CoA synthetase (NDP forming)
MIVGGAEVMVGATRDPVFGPVVAFGLGGIHIEILRDACFGIPPLTDVDADDMLYGLRGFRLLEGHRGHPPADLPALKDVVLRVAQLVEAVPEIMELDLNPVFALAPGQGCRIVDARLCVEPLGVSADPPAPVSQGFGSSPVPGAMTAFRTSTIVPS